MRNLLGLAVLSFLTERPMHPYEIGELLVARDHARSIRYNRGSLYMVVNQLVKAGLIEVAETIRDSERPERTVYRLTAAGRAELFDWLRELVGQPAREYPRFVAALSLIGALHPDEVVELLRQRHSALEHERAEVAELIETCLAQGMHPLFQVEENYRLAILDAELAFVQRFIADITDPETGWGPGWAAHHANRDAAAKG
ncbi:PadR family transcriptional regulator [Nocardia africana]|uniref:PadR family transcriptional regulator n=1 Tax=Nocardia africana TaxID=134964 RepID=UPI001C68A085|nr:PadR family transcriptional regulator [Nocardia africana]MCC3314339.1 PadR family transcriptional regulator [Nocardia africana]